MMAIGAAGSVGVGGADATAGTAGRGPSVIP
jgi:hypothetical protein